MLRHILHVCVLVALVGCEGRIGGTDNASGRSGLTCGDDAGPAPLRRLNTVEYLTTVEDLLPGRARLDDVSFLADAAPFGYDNDAPAQQPSEPLISQYHSAAVALAASAQVGVTCNVSDTACVDGYIRDWGKRAFRRPLDSEELGAFRSLFTSERSFESSARLMMQAMLESPQFLYHMESAHPRGEVDAFTVASRLSYALWNSMPDPGLLDAAANGQLESSEQLEQQARRLLDDPRSEDAFVHFFDQWSHVDHLAKVTKAAEFNFSESVRASMREESDRFIRAIFAEGGTMRDILTSRRAFVDANMATIYGVPPPPAGMWQEVELGEERAGLFTRAAFLTGHAHMSTPSPVLRGVFVLGQLLCSQPGAPPPAALGIQVTNEPIESRTPTNRESYERTTMAKQECQSCHGVINPIGYAFENFDAVGRYRTTDQNRPVDASGRTPNGVTFTGAEQLMRTLAEDRVVENCLSSHFARYLHAGGASAKDRCVVSSIQRDIHDQPIREVLLSAILAPGFLKAQPNLATDGSAQ